MTGLARSMTVGPCPAQLGQAPGRRGPDSRDLGDLRLRRAAGDEAARTDSAGAGVRPVVPGTASAALDGGAGGHRSGHTR